MCLSQAACCINHEKVLHAFFLANDEASFPMRSLPKRNTSFASGISLAKQSICERQAREDFANCYCGWLKTFAN
jgi:hypothetical protein